MNLVIRTAACTALLATGLGLAAGVANAADSPSMHGNPEGARPYWSHQTLDDCMLMAVADVVGQLSGHTPTEQEIVDLATHTPSNFMSGVVYTVPADVSDPSTWGDVRAGDTMTLLAQYGIDSTYTDDDVSADGGPATGVPALSRLLDSGNHAIAFVNGETLWHQDGDHSSADHAVVVTGIDTAANNGAGVVHLNDSGPEDGADEQVSLTTFEAAWATGGHAMAFTA